MMLYRSYLSICFIDFHSNYCGKLLLFVHNTTLFHFTSEINSNRLLNFVGPVLVENGFRAMVLCPL